MITAKNITDEQIRDLREHCSENGVGASDKHGNYYSAAVMLNLCDEALGGLEYGDMEVTDEWVAARVAWARARCAEILNTRPTGGKP